MSLARKYHPDKISQLNISKSKDVGSNSDIIDYSEMSKQFMKIDRAWKILRDPELRAQFDLKWQERQISQDHPIQDIVPFEDFDVDDSDQEELYTFPCRCGSDFVLSESDVKLCFDIVCCETCSLTIKVIYSDT